MAAKRDIRSSKKMGCLAALWSTGAQYAYKSLYAIGSLAGYAYSVYSETSDAVLDLKVYQAFDKCVLKHIPPGGLCCVTNWEEIVAEIPLAPPTSTALSALVSLATFGTGLLLYKEFCSSNNSANISEINSSCRTRSIKIVKGAAAAAVLVAYILSIYNETLEGTAIAKISQIFSDCITVNGSHAFACCVSDWSSVIDEQGQHISLLALLSKITVPLLSGTLGFFTYPEIAAAVDKIKKPRAYRALS